MKLKRIDDKLFVSSSLSNYEILEDKNINYIINLREEYHDDIYELTKRKIGYYWIPIQNNSNINYKQITQFLNLINKLNGKVLVHCDDENSRTSTMIIAYLYCNNKIRNIYNGEKYLLNIRIRPNLSNIQRKSLTSYFRIRK